MTRRRLHIALHWTQFALLLGLISTTSPTPFWALAYAGVALVWTGVAVLAGLFGRGGRKLDATGVAVHQWHHRVLYGMTAAAGILCIVWAFGADIRLQYWLFLLFLASNLHAVFHLWRHTALLDGALRMITPRALHKHL